MSVITIHTVVKNAHRTIAYVPVEVEDPSSREDAVAHAVSMVRDLLGMATPGLKVVCLEEAPVDVDIECELRTPSARSDSGVYRHPHFRGMSLQDSPAAQSAFSAALGEIVMLDSEDA